MFVLSHLLVTLPLLDHPVDPPQTAAAIISQLNDYRMTKKMRPLGWLNPWLYGLGYMGINDIASGNNPGCGTEGFATVRGWDPVGPARVLSLPQSADFETLRLPA